MMVLPSSDIRILERSADRLVVLDPPFFAAGLFVLGFAAVVLAVPFAFRSYPRWSALFWATVAATVPIATMGLVLLTSMTTITFNSGTGMVSISRELFWIHRMRTGPTLNEISRAMVVDGQGRRIGLHYLRLVLKSGETVNLGGYSSQEGHQMVADAINGFLGNRRTPMR